MTGTLDAMAWFLRAIELPDGQWACRHGSHEYDLHADLDGALEHLRAIAAALGPAHLFAHHFQSEVVRLGPAENA